MLKLNNLLGFFESLQRSFHFSGGYWCIIVVATANLLDGTLLQAPKLYINRHTKQRQLWQLYMRISLEQRFEKKTAIRATKRLRTKREKSSLDYQILPEFR